MKDLIKLLPHLKPFKTLMILNVFFNLLSTFFSLFSLALLMPLLDTLFNQVDTNRETFLAQAKPELSFSSSSVFENIEYYLNYSVIENGKPTTLIYICCVLVVAIIFKSLFRYMAAFFFARARAKFIERLRKRIYGKCLKLPLGHYTEERKGDLISKMSSDVEIIEWSIMTSFESIFRDPLYMIFSLVVMFTLSVKLTLFLLILFPISGVLINIIGKSLKRSSHKGQSLLGTLLAIFEETLSGIRIIKAFNNEDEFERKYERVNSLHAKILEKIHRKRALASPLTEILSIMTLCAIIIVGGTLVFEKEMMASTFMTYITFFAQLVGPGKAISNAFFNIKRGAASMERVEDLLETNEVIKNASNAEKLEKFTTDVELKDVWFKYRQDYVLKGINLKIPKGKTIALVGPSGSGKSTIADLIPRFYDISKGDLKIDGKSVKDLDVQSVRDKVGVVSQQSILFNDSVYNNIAFGKKGISEKEVIDAAKVANAHEFIEQLEKGYSTNIGEGGSKLSGGQRQRISIARAVLKNPEILILDEATSALDSESERLVQDALYNLMNNRTSLIIAHRLSTIKHADEIVVLDKGEIVEKGDHENLLVKNGIYRKFVEMQRNNS